MNKYLLSVEINPPYAPLKPGAVFYSVENGESVIVVNANPGFLARLGLWLARGGVKRIL